MNHILVILIGTIVTTFVAYKLANNVFHLRLQAKSVVLCAVCAFFISLLLPRVIVGTFGLLGTLGVLAVFAMIFAYIVAYYDSNSRQSPATLLTPVQPGSALENPFAAGTDESVHTGGVPIPSVAHHRISNSSSSIKLSDSAVAKSALENQSISLDELVKFAYIEKEKQNYSLALNAFVQALKLYPENISAPYLVIEIGTILKAQGTYDEAINLFSDGRNLPATIQNPILDQEFVNNIAYLRIAKNVLLKRKLGLIPLHQVPADVLTEIDCEFAEWSDIE